MSVMSCEEGKEMRKAPGPAPRDQRLGVLMGFGVSPGRPGEQALTGAHKLLLSAKEKLPNQRR